MNANQIIQLSKIGNKWHLRVGSPFLNTMEKVFGVMARPRNVLNRWQEWCETPHTSFSEPYRASFFRKQAWKCTLAGHALSMEHTLRKSLLHAGEAISLISWLLSLTSRLHFCKPLSIMCLSEVISREVSILTEECAVFIHLLVNHGCALDCLENW